MDVHCIDPGNRRARALANAPEARRPESHGRSWLGSITAIAVLCSIAADPALGWGTAGHAVIADIAESRLSEPALAEVHQLLALKHDSNLSQIASWADEWRFLHSETGLWHYVDIPLGASSYDP